MIEKEILLEGVCTFLRDNLTNLTRPTASIKVMTDEKVPPGAGEEFIGIYGDTLNNVNPPTAITKRVEHGLKVGITRRLAGIPNEQAGETILTYNPLLERIKPSMFKRAKEVTTLLDTYPNNWNVINLVNVIALANGGGQFLSPLGLVGMDAAPQKVNEDHFEAEPDTGNLRSYVGLLLEIEFRGAEFFRVT